MTEPAPRRSAHLRGWQPLAVLFLVGTGLFPACATQDRSMDPERYRAEVAWLADDARQGRNTASPELFATAEWVAQQFEQAGLQPLGDDGTWFQHFEVAGPRRLVDGNYLKLMLAAQEPLELDRDWRPLMSASNGTVEGELVLVGYGISDPEGGWDDYAGHDVTGKVVAVLRHGPKSDVEGTRYAEGGPASEKVTFSAKINEAFKRGAAALLVINDPRHHPPGGRLDTPQRYATLGGEGISASLPAASVTAEAAARMLRGSDLDPARWQAEMDDGGAPKFFAMGGVVKLVVASERPMLDTVNVLGWIPGRDGKDGEQVLIGAHMDHLGLGIGTSTRGGAAAMGQVHNGADDNASGTAGVIEAARRLAAIDPHPRRGLIFATWSGEEWGLLGSRHYAEHPALPLDRLVAVVNMDMIGRSKDGYCAVEGMGSSPGFRDLVDAAESDLGLPLALSLADKPSENSDHASFFDKGVPVVNFFTGLHDDYHMPSDDVDKINAEGGAQIALLASEVMRRIAEAPERPVFTPVAAAAPADPHAVDPSAPAPAVQAYRVVFGTSPDMGYQAGDGVRLSAVRDDTPAKRAGLLAGDVIVAFDGKPVTSLEDYSVLLFSHKPGDEISVTVRRGSETLTFQAKLTGHAGDS